MRAWWTRTASARNPRTCCCMLLEQGHLVATMRGSRLVLGSLHQALHFTHCKHSELSTTTQHVPQHVLQAMERLGRGRGAYVQDGGARSRARARDKAKRNARRVALLKERGYVVDKSLVVESSDRTPNAPACFMAECDRVGS